MVYVPRWRPVPGHYGYEITEMGVLRTWRRQGTSTSLSPFPRYVSEQGQGHYYLQRDSDGRQHHLSTRRLVQLAHSVADESRTRSCGLPGGDGCDPGVPGMHDPEHPGAAWAISDGDIQEGQVAGVAGPGEVSTTTGELSMVRVLGARRP